MRLFAASDLHVDFAANADILTSLSVTDHLADALIVAGDVAHRQDRLAWALGELRRRFAQVFFVPGNHELWVDGASPDSLHRCTAILQLCAALDVTTTPAWAGSTWVVPLLSWYDASLAGAERPDKIRGWADDAYCRWPACAPHPARHFHALNQGRLARAPVPAGGRAAKVPTVAPRVVSFSHFLPRRDLLPPTQVLRFRQLPAVAGSRLIEAQLRHLGAAVHVFGHSHIPRDRVLDGVRYVHNALGYPRERRGRPFALVQLTPG